MCVVPYILLQGLEYNRNNHHVREVQQKRRNISIYVLLHTNIFDWNPDHFLCKMYIATFLHSDYYCISCNCRLIVSNYEPLYVFEHFWSWRHTEIIRYLKPICTHTHRHRRSFPDLVSNRVGIELNWIEFHSITTTQPISIQQYCWWSFATGQNDRWLLSPFGPGRMLCQPDNGHSRIPFICHWSPDLEHCSVGAYTVTDKC